MKTAISVPDDLFRSAERASARLGLSRSELYRRALAQFLARHDDRAVTAALDRVHGGEAEAGRLDPLLQQMQAASLAREPW
jgi:hypothetical protein